MSDYDNAGEYGDYEGDASDGWDRQRSRLRAIRQRKYLHAKATRPKCQVEGCEHPAYYDCEWFPDYADHQLCRKHTIIRIMTQ